MRVAIPTHRRLRPFFDYFNKKMSFLEKVFRGRKRKAEGDDSQKAIENLKEMEEILIRKQLFLEEKIQKEVESAKKHGKANQRLALSALRRKKIHENDLVKVDGVLMKLEAQRTALENAGHNVEVMKVLEYTNKVLKISNKNLDIDKVNDIMDEIGEGLAVSDEIAAAISRPIDSVADEDELMSELMDLEAETKISLPDVPPIQLPAVSRGPLTRSKSRQLSRGDSEMAELEQWAAAN